jgi:hypothetical protein
MFVVLPSRQIDTFPTFSHFCYLHTFTSVKSNENMLYSAHHAPLEMPSFIRVTYNAPLSKLVAYWPLAQPSGLVEARRRARSYRPRSACQ